MAPLALGARDGDPRGKVEAPKEFMGSGGHRGSPWAEVSFGTGWFKMLASEKEAFLFLASTWGEV